MSVSEHFTILRTGVLFHETCNIIWTCQGSSSLFSSFLSCCPNKMQLLYYSVFCLCPYVASATLGHNVSSQDWCTLGLYLARSCVNLCKVQSCAYCSGHLKPSQLSAFQRDGPAWSALKIFHCSHIWIQMLDNVSDYMSFTFLVVSFSCGAIIQLLLFLVLIVIIF